MSEARFDRYEVLGRLGAGGMGEVLRARALGPHGFEKTVAIKKIGSHTPDGRSTDLFIREAQIAAQLQHANIVQVFDFGRFDDELFIVMELVEGCSLAAILEPKLLQREGLSLEQSLTVIAQLARALDYAHGLVDAEGRAVGVVHRDVSPANILVSRQGVVKLTDFGIAAWAHPERTSLVAGKPAYMAPEQLRGDPLDGRADIFACGVIAYEMITGRRPWTGMVDASKGATLEAIGYQPPSEHNADVPGSLDALIERMLQLDRDERLASAEELEKAALDVSYASQLKIDPRALRGLVESRHHVEHAPTVDASQQTLTAGEAQGGMTVLRAGTQVASDRKTAAPRPAPWTRDSHIGRFALPAMITVAAAIAIVFALQDAPADETTETTPEQVEPTRIDTPNETSNETPNETMIARPEQPGPSETEEATERTEPTPEVETVETLERSRVVMRASRVEPTRMEAPVMEARAEGFGTLNVFSQPWAEIWIDGVKQDRTAPTRGLRVAAGRHQLRLVNPVSGLSDERSIEIPVDGDANVRVFLGSE